AGREHLVRSQVGDRPFAEPDLARVRALVAGDDVEQGGLAGAVRPDQAGHGAFLDGDRRAVERLDAAVGLHQPVRAQQRGHRPPPALTDDGPDAAVVPAAVAGGPVLVAGMTAGRPRVLTLVMSSPPVGMIPLGRNSTTMRKMAPSSISLR